MADKYIYKFRNTNPVVAVYRACFELSHLLAN